MYGDARPLENVSSTKLRFKLYCLTWSGRVYFEHKFRFAVHIAILATEHTSARVTSPMKRRDVSIVGMSSQ